MPYFVVHLVAEGNMSESYDLFSYTRIVFGSEIQSYCCFGFTTMNLLGKKLHNGVDKSKWCELDKAIL